MTEAEVETAEVAALAERKLRIAFGTIWYPVAMGRYIYEALRRRPDVEVWTYGPFTGRWIPWKGGMHLPPSYVYKPDFPLPLGPGTQPTVVYGQVEAAKPWDPDAWIEANAGLAVVGRPKQPYIVIGTDPHVLDYSACRVIADKFACMQRPYMRPGDIWMPYGYDPVWHTQTTIPIAEREWDVTLLGLEYPARVEVMRSLAAQGYRTRLENGPAYEDARDIYHRSKVGFNWSSLDDTTARVFEVMAFGIAPVLNRVPDLLQMFSEGEHFEGFSTAAEAHEKVVGLLKHPEWAEELGRKAREAVTPHTWDRRVDDLLKAVGLLS